MWKKIFFFASAFILLRRISQRQLPFCNVSYKLSWHCSNLYSSGFEDLWRIKFCILQTTSLRVQIAQVCIVKEKIFRENSLLHSRNNHAREKFHWISRLTKVLLNIYYIFQPLWLNKVCGNSYSKHKFGDSFKSLMIPATYFL